VAISADVLRPSLCWLVGGGLANGGLLVRNLAASRDPEGFTRLATACDDDPRVSPSARSQTIYRAALIVAAKGGMLNDIVVGDVVELLDAQIERRISPPSERMLLYRLLYQLGIFAPGAPATLRALRTAGQRSPEELIDRYHLNCRPVRDLLVDYLRERQPALDYSSLVALSTSLGKLFWADLERHHPGIDSLHLSTEVSVAWKLRLRTIKKTVTGEGGGKAQVAVERINYRECLTPVRAFYLDLAHWAVEDPGRWGIWVTPCPIGEEEINRKKSKRRRKSRMDARTRERLPVLPVVVRSVLDRRTTAEALLEAGRRALPGEALSAPGTELVRSVVDPRSGLGKVWVHDSVEGADRRDLARDEDHAFWAWAAVEVLRATGVRVEELLEISHHAVVQYRLPNTGEVIPLLQIVPSKTDTERLLVVSPELAEVLGAIISRVSDESGTIPSVPFYDRHERVWLAPAPMLFQWRVGTENRAISPSAVRTLLTEALAHTGLTDADGEALRYTPHDFRRIMITDAIMNGLPPHIAQVIAGHHDINVTMGYKAVYPEEAIQAHFAFMARRRSLRPSEEYRTPTDEEWQEFLGHFERRKVSIGTCARAFSTPCIHEHACVRCSMLWPDPEQHPRLTEIRDNLTARIAEAEREGWLGEIDGLQVSLAGAEQKLNQMEHARDLPVTVRFTAPRSTATPSVPPLANGGS